MNNFFKNIPPPKNPFENGNGDKWAVFENELEITFPNDYKKFIDLYGTGYLSKFLWIFNPYSNNKHLNLMIQIAYYKKQYQDIKKEMGYAECPYPIYPEQNGLLVFGVSDNGDVFFWKLAKNPKEWSIVINQVRSMNYEEYPLNLTEFLMGIYDGTIRSKIFSKQYITKKNFFIPQNEIDY